MAKLTPEARDSRAGGGGVVSPGRAPAFGDKTVTHAQHIASSVLPVGLRVESDRLVVSEMRRARILDAVVAVIAERGLGRTSCTLVMARAGVSRRVFYSCYEDLDEALVAIMDRTLDRVSALALRALESEESWRDGMRAALAAVLSFFDDEPELARVCLVEALGGDSAMLRQRERVVGAFRALVFAQIAAEVESPSPLVAESVLASVMGIVHARLIAPEPQPLISLLGPLMGAIVAPSVADGQIAADEVRRGDELARALLARRRSPQTRATRVTAEIPAALCDPRAYRARMCLRYVAAQTRQGGRPSNRQIGDGIGAGHRGQVSTLLALLSDLGLVAKEVGGPGRPNSWWTTDKGELVAGALEEGTGSGQGGALRVFTHRDIAVSPVNVLTESECHA